MSSTPVIIHHLGIVSYEPTYQAMQHFTDTRDADTLDELWVLQHFPVYTLGQAGKREHLLNTGSIPIYHIDRGGQVTYHSPGQLIVYVLMDIKRCNFGVRQLVNALEKAVIDYLASQQINGKRREKAPGIYVNDCKIASLGLRIRRGCSYHGLSLNVNMDLTPFKGINPCGYTGLEVTQLCDLGITDDFEQVTIQFLHFLLNTLNCTEFFLRSNAPASLIHKSNTSHIL
ncbi:lipoyl(octanoyl) transferase LipB [Candidatus Parabeggiatoa sp. HSG14]|uniref:lipoyl(octanoyl) transferase LipB n=1 Tax=Candidatus Parabeggiatoa sp. HSG14 TaxID=3055593 RepID=UPI0025A82C80|nr:lipoyl(octanoyl) transferase LipB [Thiotrichales bacterium HSG14]